MADSEKPVPPVLGESPRNVGEQKAVALEYEQGRDVAPRITASGKGHVAEQILQMAFVHGIPVRQDADLVEILSVLEVDSLIPIEAYVAVGEILSYVYRVNARLAKQQKE